MDIHHRPIGQLARAGVKAVAALEDDLRYAMYEFIRTTRGPVSREQAAAHVGISRKLAAFHLDKLVSAGLLRSDFEPVGGLRKVGRIPKVYSPAETQIRISIPERRHDLLASILIDGVLAEGPQETARQAVMRAAQQRGHDAATSERRQVRAGRLGPERALTLSERLLKQHGYEPERLSPTCVRLLNCPFDPIPQQSRELVCGLNHAFLTGFIDGLGAPTVQALLEPRTGECCVELRVGTG
jgi:predicted ArsR family transcriptional regulator